MASKPETKHTKYNKKRNRKECDKERYQKQKELEELEKYREFKRQLEETKAENSWFNPNRNPYLERLPLESSQKYNKERQKRFFLQYDMENLYTRKKGD